MGAACSPERDREKKKRLKKTQQRRKKLSRQSVRYAKKEDKWQHNECNNKQINKRGWLFSFSIVCSVLGGVSFVVPTFVCGNV